MNKTFKKHKNIKKELEILIFCKIWFGKNLIMNNNLLLKLEMTLTNPGPGAAT